MSKKTNTIDLTAAVCELLNNSKDVQRVYRVSMEDLIASMIDTSDLNGVLVLKNVTETPLAKAKLHAKESKKQVMKIVKTRQKTLNSNFYKYFYSHLRVFYILFYSSGHICVYK
jgi:histone acetyltransferase (RNA polymerase elongator complex component)